MQPRTIFWFACKLFQRVPNFGNIEQNFQEGVEEGYSSGCDSDSQWEEEDSMSLARDSEDEYDSGLDSDCDIAWILE